MVPAAILLIGALPQTLIYVPIRFVLGDYEADRSWRGWVLDWPRKWLHLGKGLLIRLAIRKEPSPFGEGFGKGLGGMAGGSSDWGELLGRVVGDVFPVFLWIIVGILLAAYQILMPVSMLFAAPFVLLRAAINNLGYLLKIGGAPPQHTGVE
jgi:hypothetical protein